MSVSISIAVQVLKLLIDVGRSSQEGELVPVCFTSPKTDQFTGFASVFFISSLVLTLVADC